MKRVLQGSFFRLVTFGKHAHLYLPGQFNGNVFEKADYCGDRDELSRGNTVMDFITVILGAFRHS